MKTELFNLNDIENILVVPRVTIVYRINRFGFKPVEKRKCKTKIRNFYSNEQLQKLKDYFQSEKYKPQPVELNSMVLRYEINDDKTCTIIMRSKLNYTPLNQL